MYLVFLFSLRKIPFFKYYFGKIKTILNLDIFYWVDKKQIISSTILDFHVTKELSWRKNWFIDLSLLQEIFVYYIFLIQTQKKERKKERKKEQIVIVMLAKNIVCRTHTPLLWIQFRDAAFLVSLVTNCGGIFYYSGEDLHLTYNLISSYSTSTWFRFKVITSKNLNL